MYMLPEPKPFNEGDWVKFKSFIGENLQGFVESIVDIDGVVKVRLPDNTTVKTFVHRAEKMNIEITGEDTRGIFTELALATRDYEWCKELTKGEESK